MTGPARKPTDRLSKKKPRSLTVGVYLDDDLAVAHDRAVKERDTKQRQLEASRARRIAERRAAGADIDAQAIVAAAQAGDTDAIDRAVQTADAASIVAAIEEADAETLRPLQDAVDAAYTALEEGTLWFTFRALGRRRWKEILAEHPPTDEDHEAAKLQGQEQAQWNMDTLPMGLLPAACTSFDLTPELVEEILESPAWSAGELLALQNAAIIVQNQSRLADHRPPPLG